MSTPLYTNTCHLKLHFAKLNRAVLVSAAKRGFSYSFLAFQSDLVCSGHEWLEGEILLQTAFPPCFVQLH